MGRGRSRDIYWDAIDDAGIVELVPIICSNEMLSGFANIPDLNGRSVVDLILHRQGVHADECWLDVLVPYVEDRSGRRCAGCRIAEAVLH